MRDILLIIHLPVLVMGLGTSFAFMFLGIASSKMEKSEAQKFSLNTLAISHMGHIGLGLLLVSGIFLIRPYISTLLKSPLLITKLVLVIVLIILITLISIAGSKARKGDADWQFKKIAPMGRLALITGLTILILSVLNFH